MALSFEPYLCTFRDPFLHFYFNENILILICFWVNNIDRIHMLYLGFDICVSLLFYIRTYRYFHSWVKNVYLQYFIYTKEKGQKGTD